MQQNRSGTIDSPELRLLLACARVRAAEAHGPEIRMLLEKRVDWTAFARKASQHSLASVAGHTLAQVAPDIVPDDILDALEINIEQTRKKNRALFAELARSIEALAEGGIEAIAFRGPVAGIRAHGDAGFRPFDIPHLFVRESEIPTATKILRGLGYERQKYLTEVQRDFVRHLQGHEILSNQALGIRIDLYARLTPIHAAFDVEYQGLWRRAQNTALNGRTVLTLAPEDEFRALIIPDGTDVPWSIGSVCGAAAYIVANPNLDWAATMALARQEGSVRILRLTTLLAYTYFNAEVPPAVAAKPGDPVIGSIAARIAAQWQADIPVYSPGNDGLSVDWLRLHDGSLRRTRYIARSLLLPTATHVRRMPLPAQFTRISAYVPLKLAHDLAMHPLLRGYRALRTQSERLRYRLGNHRLALAVMPIPAEARVKLRRQLSAHATARGAVAANPNDLSAWRDLGDSWFGLKRYRQAVACYDKVLSSAPDSPTVWRKRADAIRLDPKAGDDAEEQVPDPQDANGWTRRAGFLSASQRFAEAAVASDRALAINPRQSVAMRIGIRSRIACCDWHRREDDERRISEGLRAGMLIATPFNHRAISDSEAENLLTARIWAKGITQPSQPLWRGERYDHNRIRLAYMSAEFHDHPTAVHIVGVFEHHDKARFATTAISLGPHSASRLRERIQAASDRFIEVESMTDCQAAAMLRELEIDIVIDLNGHAGAGRPGILAQRPAPVQVSYLGNAGTTGAPFLDYIIADRTVIPSQHFRYYTEKVVWLPHSYQCNDSRRQRPQSALSRADADLPATGFVYCCFNSNYKIAPAVFEIWMRLLIACPGSVLWLLGDDPNIVRNLRREAAARGVGPDQLVFAPRLSADDHLARHHLADLFLDTLPMNAHATASDALWSGLPVLTCLGHTFGGRVAASLLRAVGLSELVTQSLSEYEALALALARDTERLAGIRAKLLHNRETEPLFNTAGFTRDLESAYATMWLRQQAGLPPTDLTDRAGFTKPCSIL